MNIETLVLIREKLYNKLEKRREQTTAYINLIVDIDRLIDETIETIAKGETK